MAVLMLTQDLVFSSRVSGSATAAGTPLRVVRSGEELLRDAEAQADLGLVILDLTTPGCDVAGILEHLRQRQPPPKVVAYAPHVVRGALEQARAAGCDQVLTRGQFHRGIDQLLSR